MASRFLQAPQNFDFGSFSEKMKSRGSHAKPPGENLPKGSGHPLRSGVFT
jgi:hypothetical protein